MRKRSIFPADEMDGSHVKRLKLINGTIAGKSKEDIVFKIREEEIVTTQQLRQLLLFQQDGSPKFRQNIQRFKSFLEQIAYGEQSQGRQTKTSMLLEYLTSIAPAEDDRTSDYLGDVIQTWRFGAENNHDGLLTAVPAVLALLLKTISSLLDFRDFGVGLCKTLLRKDQLRLFDRGLTATKTKENLIAPCLRLLTEVVAFDGGSTARDLYLQRDVTFKRLDVFLTMRKPSATGNIKSKSTPKPSVRSNALRYLLCNLRLQHATAKADILSQSKLIRGVFLDIKEDLPEVILNILESMTKDVVLDEALARTSKSRLLTDWTLSHILTLYQYSIDTADAEGQTSVRDAAHAFLMFVCTTVNHGVLVSQHGWYPSGSETMHGSSATHAENTPNHHLLDKIYSNKVPVRNTILASFIQGCRPYASTRQRELVLAIFSAAPELIAPYFFAKRSFSFEPKLSATWIGYSVFLFSTVQLPVPKLYVSWDDAVRSPPPVSIVIESILPQPLNAKTLTRCLNQNSDLIAFFALRLLIVAFDKLEGTLQWLRSCHRSPEWTHSASELISEFCRRCPELKHVIAAFRGCLSDRFMLREAFTRLLAMYYKLTPQIALAEKFDISLALVDSLGHINSAMERNHLRSLELNNLLEIAYRSPDMRWWQKPDKLPLSPFTSVIRSHVSGDHDNCKITELLHSITSTYAIFQQDTSPSALSALLVSLEETRGYSALDTLYEFLDNCILRTARKPIKYQGDIEQIKHEKGLDTAEQTSNSISILFAALLEQWPFFVAVNQASTILQVATWLSQYINISLHIGESALILHVILESFREQSPDTIYVSGSKSFWVKPLNDEIRSRLMKLSVPSNQPEEFDVIRDDDNQSHALAVLEEKFNDLKPSEESDDHPGLTRWKKKDVVDAIEDGDIGELVLCLCSKQQEVRLQALVNLQNLMSKVESSGYSEWQQIYLLLGELIDSAKENIRQEVFSGFAGVLTAHSLTVLANPLHFMYQKVNKFLNKSPQWNTARLPSYWIDKIFLHPPTDDDAHYLEVGWILEILAEGLQNSSELDLYRRCSVFERVLSLSNSPAIPEHCVATTIKLLYRCTTVDGSMTLLTRCGVLSWIQARIAQRDTYSAMMKLLASKIIGSCDKEKVTTWSGGALVEDFLTASA